MQQQGRTSLFLKMSFSAAVDFYIQYKHNINVAVVVDFAAVADSGFYRVFITIIIEQESEKMINSNKMLMIINFLGYEYLLNC